MPDKEIKIEEIKTHSVTSCPLCQSAGELFLRDLVDRLYQSPGKWNLRKCSNQLCSLLWLDPAPNIDEVWKVYSRYYTHSDNSNSGLFRFLRWVEAGYQAIAFGYKENTTVIQRITGALVYLLPTEKAECDFNVFELRHEEAGRLLDVGCGNGSFISRMKKRGWDAEGIESDKKAVESCLMLGLNVKFGDLNSQKFPENSFDVVTLSHVIEHVYDPVTIITEIHRILKPGGQLVLATPNSKSWMFNKKFKSNWFAIQSPGHMQIFNRNNLYSLLNSCGFSIKSGKTSARNEFYVYVGSRSIKENGYFAMGVEKPNKYYMLVGKFFQLKTWIKIHFNKDAGGELFIKAIK